MSRKLKLSDKDRRRAKWDRKKGQKKGKYHLLHEPKWDKKINFPLDAQEDTWQDN